MSELRAPRWEIWPVWWANNAFQLRGQPSEIEEAGESAPPVFPDNRPRLRPRVGATRIDVSAQFLETAEATK
jgi:hypothetical protein